jgi:pimeloyl-ACP methyl ester carboxylesterase
MRDRPDRTAELASISIPSLIVVGDADVITPVAVAQSMQMQIPNAMLAVIRGAGHMTPMEQPGQVNQVLRRFVSIVQ